MFTKMVEFFQQGGFFMWPIAIVFAVGLAIAIERYLYLTRHTMLNRSLWDDLVPYLKQHYAGNVKKARSVAYDQTRKAYNNISAARSQKLGMEEFIWIHSGGGKEPRKDHVAMNGKTFRFDDPPVIGVMYGQEVRGLPGNVPSCRCAMRPLVNFKALIAQKEEA